MKYLRQACLIFLFTFLGELLHYLIPLPIPASIYGMVLLFAALGLKIIRIEAVKDVGGFLTSILPVLFVAPAVNLMDCWDLLSGSVVSIAVVILVTTVLTFAVSGWVTGWLVRRKGGKRND